MKSINGFSPKELFLLAINKPIMAQLELTKNCNQACNFCFRRCVPKKNYNDLSLDQWKKIISALIDFGVEEFNFSGGEILLNKDADKLFGHARKKGASKLVLNTNGTIHRPICKNIDLLVFSIHGIGSSHDETVGKKGAFDLAFENLLKSIKEVPVAINTVVDSKNIDSLNKIFNYFSKLNLVFHSFTIAADPDNIKEMDGWIKKNFPKYQKFLKKVPSNRMMLRHGLHNIIINDLDFFDAQIPLPHCAAGKYKLLVDFKGDVYPCSFFQSKDFYCGNILSDDIEKIWKEGKGFKIFREQVLDNKLPDKCQNCFKKYKCRGGCMAWRYYDQENKNYERDIRCTIGDAYIGG